LKSNQIQYLIASSEQGLFLRDILADRLRLSHALLVRLKQQYKIRVNGRPARTNTRLQAGDRVTVDLDLAEENRILPQTMKLEIVYEDDDFLVVDKPPGMAIHPSRPGGTGTLANGVTAHWQAAGLDSLFRPINRLDMDTSGLVLVGKNQFAHQGLFNRKDGPCLEKRYLALAEGVFSSELGCIDLPILRPDEKMRRRTVHPDGQPAVTHYQVQSRYPAHTLLSLSLETGRTHQIRVHLSHLGHPVCGDAFYGRPSPLIGRQALHAHWLRFIHPRDGREIILQAPLPGDMQRALQLLQK